MKKLILVFITFGLLMHSPASAVTFLGDKFDGSYRFPHVGRTTINSGSSTVSPVAKFTFLTGRINPTAQISTSNVLITFAGDGTYNQSDFNGILLRNLSRSNIAGVTLDPGSTLLGFDQSRLSHTSDSLLFNFEGLSIRSTDRVSANVSFLANAVPEPYAWTLMVLGFGAVGFAMRRRTRDNLRVRYAY